jgi:hypothetical protein
MDSLVRKDRKVNLVYPESKETQVRSEFMVNRDPPVRTALKANQGYLAEMVSTAHLA